ncbi:response regulator transcription factor [Cohnella sp. 56]|uniref:response regulator transcription factor n=1 Tax=Cohnella sp. 56 TaxID=3113722 RepID=UPI0030E9238F
MTQMLIVDDEPFAVDGIRQCADWEALGIRIVHTAHHADEAKKIMQAHPIDILICDIEMPDEDGLSVVRWVKERFPHIESLFLTCHSEFSYAKQAIQLGSYDYLLKPVDGGELVQVVVRMLQKIKERQESQQRSEQYQKAEEMWRRQQPLLAEKFWQDLLSRRILSFGNFLERAIDDSRLALAPSDRVLPILISIEEWKKPLDERDQDIMEYAVKKAADEVFLSGMPGDVIVDRSGVLFAMIYADEAARDAERWTNAGTKFIEICQTYFYCQVACYVGHHVQLQDVSRLCDALKSLERNNVSRKQSVIMYTPQAAAPAAATGIECIDDSVWLSCMLGGEQDKIVGLIERSVEQLESDRSMPEKRIETLCHMTLRIVYDFLHVKRIAASEVPQFTVWATAQIRSLSQYKHWAENLICAVMETAYSEQEAGGVVHKSIQYMKEQVEENISRDDVAAHVNLNPAYLSRLFKKETGANLIDYMIEIKMNRAKQLLDGSSMTVGAIAQQVGYSNFSHFTKMFKKQFGVNPQQYRNVTKRLD